MKHVLLRDPRLNGWEYGMLRSFERAIVEETGAETYDIPSHSFAGKYSGHFEQGMARGKYRKYFSKKSWTISGDIAWYILMGPENYSLDILKGWDRGWKKKILYLYDTFPSQYPLIKRILETSQWDVLITSFNDAVPDLEKITGKKWHAVPQAADSSLFECVPMNERVIHFSSYGRRYAPLHEALKKFCLQHHLYYDYTTHDAKHPVADSPELYRQYAWHLSHSMFTFSWPVEFTNPQRAGHLHPITCRWFEAMAAGTPVIGRKPANEIFNEWLHNDLVLELEPNDSEENILKKLHEIWLKKDELLQQSINIAKTKGVHSFDWNARVKAILSLL